MATPAVHSRVCASVNRMASRLVFWNHIVRVSHSCGHIEDHCSLGQTDTHTSSSLLLSVRAWRRLWCCQLTSSGCINQFSAKIEDHGRCPFIKLSSNPTPFFSPSQHTLPKEIKKITTPRPSPRIVPPLPPPPLSCACLLIGSRANSVPTGYEREGRASLCGAWCACVRAYWSVNTVCRLHTRVAGAHVPADGI